MEIDSIFAAQKNFFFSHITKDVAFRIALLKQLKELLIKYEAEMYAAIMADFGKSPFDTFLTELALIHKDIDFYITYLKDLAIPKLVSTNLPNLPGHSRIYHEPLGVVLIIGAWNYPYQLCFAPLIAAIAAGNVCIVKPSELPAHTMRLMAQMLNSHFDPEQIYVVEGGVPETTALLQLPFDKIFFTGSTRVGKIVYEAAAKNLTPVVLELGGKSPVFVSSKAAIDVAARRIVWGKFLNAGQTCVAPDYVLVAAEVKEALLQRMQHYLLKFNYHADAPHYTRIINKSNFDRLLGLIPAEKVFVGGSYNADNLYIAPTILNDIDWTDKVMEEEIFGPILPVLSYTDYGKAIQHLVGMPKPLAAYLFSNDKSEQDLFLQSLSFGGGCINDVLVHLSNEHLPFGGVGHSGIGSYHGIYGFETFSHRKPVISRAVWGEPPLRYPPYTKNKLRWIKRFL